MSDSDWIALGALLISALSLGWTARTHHRQSKIDREHRIEQQWIQAEQLRLDREHKELERKVLVADLAERLPSFHARLRAEDLLSGRFRVHLDNVGKSAAVALKARIWSLDEDDVEWFPDDVDTLPDAIAPGASAEGYVRLAKTVFSAGSTPEGQYALDLQYRDPSGTSHRGVKRFAQADNPHLELEYVGEGMPANEVGAKARLWHERIAANNAGLATKRLGIQAELRIADDRVVVKLVGDRAPGEVSFHNTVRSSIFDLITKIERHLAAALGDPPRDTSASAE